MSFTLTKVSLYSTLFKGNCENVFWLKCTGVFLWTVNKRHPKLNCVLCWCFTLFFKVTDIQRSYNLVLTKHCVSVFVCLHFLQLSSRLFMHSCSCICGVFMSACICVYACVGVECVVWGVWKKLINSHKSRLHTLTLITVNLITGRL